MRPADTEYAPFYATYIARVPERDPMPALEAQPAELQLIADRMAPDEELFRYAPDKWSVRQLFGHLIDTERVMGYRAFCIARGEAKPLPGFDEKEYVARADSDERPVKALAHEFAAVRHANLWAIRRWESEDWDRIGNANGKAVSARALAYIMAGHVRHHVALLRERYGLEV
ncbi:MAG TPA: DinB family protein [Vicinamibacterales bacterium]|nr:DinB family protein [Vicinamibacterales bacterium]